MSGTTVDKNLINLKNLSIKAKKDDKSFLYYDNSKSKINSIIRKNQLPDYIISYLWQSKIYKKELVRNQKNLPQEVRKDIIDNCLSALSESPWTSILRNFLKNHEPTGPEIMQLMNVPSSAKSHNGIILECWENVPYICFSLGMDNKFYNILRSEMANASDYKLRRIVSIMSNIINSIPEMRIPLMQTVLENNNEFATRQILVSVFKTTTVGDDVADYLLTHAKKSIFKEVAKHAIQRHNISENMIAKIYLAMD